MKSNSEQERERLKEEYKQHYRKIKDAKEKLQRSRYVQNVNEAIHNMDASDLLDSVDHFLGHVRHKMAHIEARLDVAMDEFLNTSDEDAEEFDEDLKKERAKQTLKQIKLDMGLLYREIEQQAEEYQTEKTIGKERPENVTDPKKEGGSHG